MSVSIIVADSSHAVYAEKICELMYVSAQERGTGIARRTPEYITQKMTDGKAVIALDKGEVVGFSYIESWSHSRFVANSGLIVVPEYRSQGLAKRIKKKAVELSRSKFPDSKIFGLTTGLAVMKINSELGYKPVTFSELTDDQEFWKGCQSCVNYDILMRTERTKCLCTAMLYDPAWEKKEAVSDAQTEEKEEKLSSLKKWFNRRQENGSESPMKSKFKLFKKQ